MHAHQSSGARRWWPQWFERERFRHDGEDGMALPGMAGVAAGAAGVAAGAAGAVVGEVGVAGSDQCFGRFF